MRRTYVEPDPRQRLFLHHLVTEEMQAGRLINRNDHWRWEGTMQASEFSW